MKSASAATLAILATGRYVIANLYQIDLANGAGTVYLTSADTDLTISGNTYSSNLVIERGAFTQKIGLEVGTLDLTIYPRFDTGLSHTLFSGFNILQATNLGILDNARVTWSKAFLASWADTSPGLVVWNQFRVNNAQAGRQFAQLRLATDVEILNVPMPKNIVQSGCIHTLFDAGCGLNPASFQISGAVTGSPTVSTISTNLTQANGYFDLGRMTFTSGVNNGLKRAVKSYVNASGQLTLIAPLPAAPTAGDTFTILPSCQKTQAACSNTNPALGPAFNNLVRFRGYPYVPVPETLYDGGVSANNAVAPTGGSQGGSVVGSTVIAKQLTGKPYGN